MALNDEVRTGRSFSRSLNRSERSVTGADGRRDGQTRAV